MNVVPDLRDAAPDVSDPGPAARAVSQRLMRLLHDEVRSAGGFIPFRRYMEAVLYQPGLGYYSAGSRKFGAEGDFITAPELSPLFAACLSRQCAEILEATGGGVVLEIGAGSGALACGLLHGLKARATLPEAYWILETSADLRERQRRRIHDHAPELAERVRWLDVPPADPWRGVLIANEVLDALPVERFNLEQHRVWQAGVASEDNAFHWASRVASVELNTQVGELLAALSEPLPEPYRAEINPRLGPWLASVAGNLHVGVALFLDYGYPRQEYYHPQRSDGTLICHYRHRAHSDPFLFPGLQDVSASVDFTAVAEWGLGAGMDLCGYTTLAHFLIGCGLEEALRDNADADGLPMPQVARAARLLTMPGEMGERFKAIALGRGVSLPLRGFSAFDQRPRLFAER